MIGRQIVGWLLSAVSIDQLARRHSGDASSDKLFNTNPRKLTECTRHEQTCL
ncbi:hypothetical protein DEV91_107134 [Phyllobacterium brassicacearum]|nr:hypothetical protein DEV91_107134 [Phyllobacterium brassicacearum]